MCSIVCRFDERLGTIEGGLTLQSLPSDNWGGAMSKTLLAALMLAVVAPAHAQARAVQKWEYAVLYTHPWNHQARWMAPDSVVNTKTLSELTVGFGGKSTLKDFGLASEFLNAVGEKGWELIGCERQSPAEQSATLCYFKRPKE